MSKQLLFSITKKDFEISYYNGTGCGGQNRNKNQNCVHLKHKDSGVFVSSQNQKSREQNLKNAFNKLIEHPKFKVWHSKKVMEVLGIQEEIEKEVEKSLDENNLKTETKINNKWMETKI